MQATSEFSEKEKNLILQLDEIHVKSNVDYKRGKIFGYSLQPDHPIKTVVAIMASSLYRKWSEIVRLLPCSSTSATEIYTVVKSVIGDIERCGLNVQVIGTDNYPLNVNFFKLFSSDKKTLTPAAIHPIDPKEKSS